MFLSPAIKALSPETVRQELKAHRILLIDVREPAEFAAERIHGALLFPLSTFDPEALPAADPRPIVFHCGSGKRSAMAIERCRKAGLAVDAHMEGGIGAWIRAGLPTVKLDADTGAVRDAR
ncbi:rhodanese-like domain-containing protein [Phenylobacterium montanum]|uniref:Rhodanese-like domain-containing protein n=1 Tax=Phenylobacterium montanum TaxID=2823693 RepID=A0A975G1A9_9CAUL|nr:rhodanese-like domain-containing protein [Caulobacter sp. S6]QUD88732.1 rhodanese-like domain-containing protein [Caulobacter sp. S6]